jgi:hypothetical protein
MNIVKLRYKTQQITLASSLGGLKFKQKKGPPVNRGPIGMKVKNLQRGTASAVELGGKSHHVHQLRST